MHYSILFIYYIFPKGMFQTRAPPPESALNFYEPPDSPFSFYEPPDSAFSFREPPESVLSIREPPESELSIHHESAENVLRLRQIEDIFEEYANNASAKKKLIHLSSGQLKSLNLNYGHNIIAYTATTAPSDDTYSDRNAKRIYANIFLWHHSDKIVISDIDGTITKSDIRG